MLRSGDNRLVQRLFRDDKRLTVPKIPVTAKTRVAVVAKSRHSLPHPSATASLAKHKKSVCNVGNSQ